MGTDLFADLPKKRNRLVKKPNPFFPKFPDANKGMIEVHSFLGKKLKPWTMQIVPKDVSQV